MSDITGGLYHYTSYDSLLKILETYILKFNNITHTNDPREYQEPIININPCLTDTDNSPDREDIRKRIIFELRKHKILCLSKNYDRPRMWAQYGKKNEGCCLIIDQEELEKELSNTLKNKHYGREIIYSDDNSAFDYCDSSSDVDIQKFVENNIDNLLFTKLSDWRDEAEYRYVIRSDREEEFLNIKKCLGGIVFGDKFPLILKEKVIEYLREDKIYINAGWFNGGFSAWPAKYHNYNEYWCYRCKSFIDRTFTEISNGISPTPIGNSRQKNEIFLFYKLITKEQKNKIDEWFNIIIEHKQSTDFYIRLFDEIKELFDIIITNIKNMIQD